MLPGDPALIHRLEDALHPGLLRRLAATTARGGRLTEEVPLLVLLAPLGDRRHAPLLLVIVRLVGRIPDGVGLILGDRPPSLLVLFLVVGARAPAAGAVAELLVVVAVREQAVRHPLIYEHRSPWSLACGVVRDVAEFSDR